MPTINTKSARTYGRTKPNNFSSVEKTDARREIYQSTQWHNMRSGYLQEHPLCEVHLLNGEYVPAEHVHHKKSFMLGKDQQEQYALAFSYKNLCALCSECHNTLHGIVSNTIEGTTTGQSPTVIYNMLSSYYKKIGSKKLQTPVSQRSGTPLF